MQTQNDCEEILFYTTNESIPSIIEGLSPSERDRILAVCGSGDQPLALLEYCKVITTDIRPEQIEILFQKIDMLKRNKFIDFLEFSKKETSFLEEVNKLRREYFNQKGRLERITARIENLEVVEPMDIEELSELAYPRFNKVYLSNSLTYGLKINEHSSKKFLKVYERIPKEGLIYLTEELPEREALLCNFEDKIDIERTSRARAKTNYFWMPIVIKKS